MVTPLPWSVSPQVSRIDTRDYVFNNTLTVVANHVRLKDTVRELSRAS